MNIVTNKMRADRHPSDLYEDILRRDTREVPEHLLEGNVPDLGTAPIPVSRYIEREFFIKEAKYLWPKIWQMACREEEIPEPGDYYIYEIVGKSLLVTRQKDGSIRAFGNSCLHRGRKLATLPGCKNEFRCPYHGIAWNIDGSFKDNPIDWDFPQWKDRSEAALPEAKVETWAGYVFVNFDRNAAPLEESLQPMKEHFERYDHANRYISLHVQKVVPGNWKAVAEAFMESHHTVTTHPQLLPYLADANSQYDVLSETVSRQFSAQMVSSPLAGREYTEAEIVKLIMEAGGRQSTNAGGGQAELVDGVTARAFMADMMRQTMASETGVDYSERSDAELVDALLYNVFPHMSFWAGYMPNLVYRWRPNGTDHETSLMDIYILKPVPKEGRPRPSPVFEIGIDESMVEVAPQAGMAKGLAAVFEQDMQNLPHVQTGMKASLTGYMHFSKYAEVRIRHHHNLIMRYIAEGEAADAAAA